MNYPPTEEEVNSQGNPDYCTPPWEKEDKPKPNVYNIKPPKPDYDNGDNWAGDPEQAGW